MSLVIDFSPQEAARIAEYAVKQGRSTQDLAREVLLQTVDALVLPAPDAVPFEDPTLALFAEWDKEDAQMTDEQIADEAREWEQFKNNLNAEREKAGARILYPR